MAGRRGLDAFHVIAHGAPGRVSFAAGDWSAETLKDEAADFAAIGAALAPSGDLRLWSCLAGAGKAAEALLEGLAWATCAHISAATSLVGAAALGGGWELAARSRATAARPSLTTVAQPPLTDYGMAGYMGVLVAKSWSAGRRWNTAGNWTPAGVPAAGDDVTIARAGVTMTLDVNTANLNSIAVSNATTALAVSTFALNVTGTGASAINVTAGTSPSLAVLSTTPAASRLR